MNASADPSAPDETSPASDEPEGPPPPRPPRAPWVTMALNLALIATIFLTRERWGAWIVESREPCEGIPAEIRALSPDARRAVIPWDDRWVLWDVERSRKLAAFQTGASFFTMFTRDGSRMLATVQSEGDKEETVVVDAESGARLSRLAGVEGVHEASSSPDGRLVVATAADGYARIWNVDDGSIAAELGEYPDGLWNAEFFPDGETVLTAGPGDVRLWDARTGRLRVRLVDDDAERTDARVCAGGRNVFTCSAGRGLLVEAASGKCLRDVGTCQPWDVSDGGLELAVWDESAGAVAVLDAATGETLFERRLSGTEELDFADGGNRLFVKRWWDCPDVVTVLDARTGDVVGDFAYDDRQGLDMSPDGARILVKERWSPARLHSARTGRLLAEWHEPWPVGFLGNDRVMLNFGGETDELRVLRRIRPEEWWGVFCLWHLWLIVALGGALAWSVRRDLGRMRGRHVLAP